MEKRKIEAIIFDLDGTLVNSVFDITEAINHVLHSMQRELLSSSTVQAMVGSGVKKLVSDVLHDVSDEVVLAKALKDFQEYYSKNLTNKTRPYSDVLVSLEKLSNLKKSVYSNKPQKLTERVVRDLKIAPFMDLVRGADENKYQRKPSGEGITYILNQLDVRPENTLMVGDSTHDIQAGKKAGVLTCAVTYGYREEALLEKESPDFIIHNLSELARFVQ